VPPTSTPTRVSAVFTMKFAISCCVEGERKRD
jgi:hypothetical protein